MSLIRETFNVFTTAHTRENTRRRTRVKLKVFPSNNIFLSGSGAVKRAKRIITVQRKHASARFGVVLLRDDGTI